MKKYIMIAVAALTLGTASFAPADAEVFGPRCGFHHCIHGVVIHPHRVCVVWEIFGGERHCARWRWSRF